MSHEPEPQSASGLADPASKPAWLHPSSLFFDLFSHARQFALPVLIAVFSASQGSWTGMLFGLAILVPAVLYSIVSYFTLRYSIAGGELVVRRGLIFRSVRTIPLFRIQNVDLVQNLFHRMLGVAEVCVETAGGSEPEARLRVLSLRQVEELRRGIFENRGYQMPAPVTLPYSAGESGTTVSGNAAEFIPGPETLLELSTGQLVRAGLASNRGLLLIGLVIGLYWQFDLHEYFDLRRLVRFLPSFTGSLLNLGAWAAAILGIFLLLRVVGAAWYVLRFYGYRLGRHGEDLRISCGLFTRVSATIPRKRIQFVSIHRTMIMKWMGLAAIRIETAGGSSGESQNASASVSRQWFVPVIDESRVTSLLAHLRDGLEFAETALTWQPLARNAFRRMMRGALLVSFAIGVIGFFANRQFGWIAGIIAAPLLIAWARKKSRSMSYSRNAERVVFKSGVLNRVTSMTFFDKIQSASFQQSPFDRRWGHGKLFVDTAGAGPAEHSIHVEYLDADFAEREYYQIAAEAVHHQPDFG